MLETKTIRRNGTGFFIEGDISDGNVIIVTKDGKEHQCDRPNRLGIQSGTPWLMNSDEPREGDRLWNIDPVEIMNKFNSGDYYQTKAFFVIGKWGSGYNTDDGVLDTVRLTGILGFKQLVSEVPCDLGCSCPNGHMGRCWVTPSRLVKDLNLSKQDVIAMFQKWFDGLDAGQVADLGYKVGLTNEQLIPMVEGAKRS
jgi:hypothetical protein